MPNMYMPRAMHAIRALLVGLSGAMKKEKPVNSREMPMSGKVVKSKLRRPNVSIV